MDPGRDGGAECASFLSEPARLGAAEPASVVAFEAGTDSFSGFMTAAGVGEKRRVPGVSREWSGEGGRERFSCVPQRPR